MPPKKKAAKAKAPAADRKYSHLPRDLQRAAQHMDRVAFIRQLQRAQADRQYKHVTTQTGSELSSTGAVDLAGKIDLLQSKLDSTVASMRSHEAEMKDIRRGRSEPPPQRPVPGIRRRDEQEFMGGYTIGGSSGSGAK